MKKLAFLVALFFALGLAAPAFAHDENGGEQDHPHYNYKGAPKDDAAQKEHEEDQATIAKEDEEELSTPQKEEMARRKMNGETSDIYHGDEYKWPSSGKRN